MTNDIQGGMWDPVSPGAPEWLTLAFILIGLGVIFALVVIVWGARVARRRHQAYDALEKSGDAYHAGEPAPLVSPTPPPIVPAPPAVAPAPPPLVDAPIAPPPPPAPVIESPVAAPSAPVAPATSEGDDLTRMKGVGPRLAAQLNSVGITRFEQLAALRPEEAEALDASLGSFQGRIHRDRWIEQARYLAAGDTAGFEGTFGKL